MTLQTRLTALATAVGTDIKTINSKLGTVVLDPWHTVGSTGQSPFLNGWTAQPGYTVRYRKDPFGKVSLSGVVHPGTSTTILNLPVGYRPVGNERAFVCQTNSGTVMVYVSPNGDVVCSSTAITYVYLDPVEFDTETVAQVLAGPQGPAGPQGVPGSSVQVPMDPWHVVGTTGEPGFLNGWVNYGTYGATAAFRKFPDGRVKLRGLVRSGTVAASASGYIFVLPAGYRPQAPLLFPISANATFGEVRVLPDGGILAQVGNNSYFALDEIEFDTETVTQFAVGPQGPKGDPGGITGLMKDLDGINAEVYAPFRSRLMFKGPNFKLTDGGAADGFGGGDYTSITYGPQQGGGPLQSVNVREGQEYDLVVASGVVWRMRYIAGKWTMVGGAPQTYSQVGESSAYAGISSGQVVTVNAALTKALQWQYTPLVDMWVEVEFFLGLVAKMDAAYNYVYFSTQCNPQPPIIAFDRIGYRTQHSSVQQYENYTVKARYGLSAGVTYAMNCVAAMSGGVWQFFQGPGQLNMNGKAWPR